MGSVGEAYAGVVSVQRGRLDGVADTVVIGFDHFSVVQDPSRPSSRRVQAEIMKRISS